MECETKLENPGSPDREDGAERNARPEGGTEGMAEETDDSKKRKRKPYRPGKQVKISQNKYNI